MTIGTTGQFRAYGANVSAAAAVLTAGRYTKATLEAALPGAWDAIISMGPATGDPNAARRRFAEVQFVGVGADNATGSYRAWQVKRGRASQAPGQPSDIELALLGTGTFTLSTAVGALLATTVPSTERIADTVTWTQATTATNPKGPGAVIETALGAAAAAAYSPADNTPGRLVLTEVGNGDLLIELYGTAPTTFNAVVEVGN